MTTSVRADRVEASRHDVGRVEHEPVPGMKVDRQVLNSTVLDKRRAKMNDHEPGRLAGLGGLPSDEGGIKVEIKLFEGEAHPRVDEWYRPKTQTHTLSYAERRRYTPFSQPFKRHQRAVRGDKRHGSHEAPTTTRRRIHCSGQRLA